MDEAAVVAVDEAVEAAALAAQADSKAATVVVAAATAVAAAATVVAAAAMATEAVAATAAEAPQETEAVMDVTIAADPDDHDQDHHHDEAADRHPNTMITEDRSSIASSFLCLACLNCTFLLPFFFPLPITDIFVLFISS